jgi:hypothetical protein
LTPQEYNRHLWQQQRNQVRASLLLAEDRRARHEIHVRTEMKRCPSCGQHGGLMFCERCAGQAA